MKACVDPLLLLENKDKKYNMRDFADIMSPQRRVDTNYRDSKRDAWPEVWGQHIQRLHKHEKQSIRVKARRSTNPNHYVNEKGHLLPGKRKSMQRSFTHEQSLAALTLHSNQGMQTRTLGRVHAETFPHAPHEGIMAGLAPSKSAPSMAALLGDQPRPRSSRCVPSPAAAVALHAWSR